MDIQKAQAEVIEADEGETSALAKVKRVGALRLMSSSLEHIANLFLFHSHLNGSVVVDSSSPQKQILTESVKLDKANRVGNFVSWTHSGGITLPYDLDRLNVDKLPGKERLCNPPPKGC
ncbi:hypothetical protein F2P81_013395 [Scophthalmus maximus]|uniref:Uncharacterized protein n=1 Tax=Scophthalmus maximus TaxID=52904 RepID=A0A6A4SL62_SCOMX|nr:hypothetical protein F2P81_013395 [Scophthalmus maximus]